MSKLLPCPFCGSSKVEFKTDGDGNGWGKCKNCGASGPHENKRQSEDDPSWDSRIIKEAILYLTIETFPPVADLPGWDDLRGRAPDALGGLSSEGFVRELRDGWR